MIKKGLAVAVILLFIGVAFTPSINSSVVEDKLVEFDVEFCGLGKKHTVKLTQQETVEVELLFDEIRTKLDNVESRDEAGVIFKEAVVELDKYGLLRGLSVRQAQRLATGGNQNPRFMNILEKFKNRNLGTLDIVGNFRCWIVGRTNNTHFIGGILKIAWSIYINVPFPFNRVFGYVIVSPLLTLCLFKPFFLGADITIDNGMGWIWTDGLLGTQTWEGLIKGILPVSEPCTAIGNFNGIRILQNYGSYENYYLGHARIVEIEVIE